MKCMFWCVCGVYACVEPFRRHVSYMCLFWTVQVHWPGCWWKHILSCLDALLLSWENISDICQHHIMFHNSSFKRNCFFLPLSQFKWASNISPDEIKMIDEELPVHSYSIFHRKYAFSSFCTSPSYHDGQLENHHPGPLLFFIILW